MISIMRMDTIKSSIFVHIIFLFYFGFFNCAKSPTRSEPNPNSEPPVVPSVEFETHAIDVNFAGIHAIKVIDLDGDGDLDIVGGSEITPYSQSRGVAWWRNNGGTPLSWTRFMVDSGFEHVMSIDVADIDGDMSSDIVATSWSLNQIVWWKHSGNPESNWTRTVIRSGFINAHDALCGDLNGDGNTDVAGVSSGGDVLVCMNDGGSPPGWDHVFLNSTFGGGKRVYLHDLDKDGDEDIMGTASDANRITWWENMGGIPISWASHPVDHAFTGSSGIDVVDLNGDGLDDVIGASWKSNTLAYWLCQDLASDQWQKTVVSDQLAVAVSAQGCDLDLDGDLDIVAAGKNPGELAIYLNDDFSWTKQVLTSGFEGATALSVIDLDSDGDMDIIAGASGRGSLIWWENKVNVFVE